MPRTLDEIIAGYQSAREAMYGPTPLPPTTLLSTPPPSMMLRVGMPPPMMYSPAMMSMQSPAMFSGMTPQLPSLAVTQQDLIARAMPRPIPMPQMPQMPQFGTQQMAMAFPTPMPSVMPTPMLRTTPGVTGAFVDPTNEAAYQMLSRTAGYLDPSQAGEYAKQQWGQKAERIGQTIGAAASFIPGVGPLAGIALSFLGGKLFNNPLTRAIFGPSEAAAQHMSMMANLQHRTFGHLQLIGGDVGLGGVGMSQAAAMQLGQQFTARAETWGRIRGARDEDVQKYKQDLIRMTEMAAQAGLLDAATNIDQISDTVLKLMKVMGRMAKLTGDPDFRNNLQNIAQLRTLGLSIDQAVETTRSLAFYARGAGVSQQQLFQQGGIQGMQAWAQAGLAPGIGIGHGAMAQARARQFAGVLDPYTEQIMGGREGIQQRLTSMGAQFVAGPAGQLIMSAIMGFNAQGELTTDIGRFQSMMTRGMNMSQLASEAMQNFHRTIEEAMQRHGLNRAEAVSQILEKRQALLSQMAADPEELQMMQLGMYETLRRGGVEMTAAAFEVGGRTMEGAMLIKRLASDPTIRERMRVQLNERLRALRIEARREREEQREQIEEWRSAREWDEFPIIGALRRERRRYRHSLDVQREREAEELAREEAESRAEAAGEAVAFIGRTNARLVEEFSRQSERLARRAGMIAAEGQGLDRYERARRMLLEGGTEFGMGAFSNQFLMSTELLGVAQRAAGERDTFFGDIASGIARGLWSVERGLTQFFGIERPGYRELDKTYIEALDNVFRNASAIEAVRHKSFSDLAKSSAQLEHDLIKAGGDPRKVRAALQSLTSELITEVERGVRSGGKGMDRKKLRGIVRDKLIAAGLTRDQADASLAKYEKEWDREIMLRVREYGGPEARLALAQEEGLAAEAEEKLRTMSLEDLQKHIDKSSEKWIETLDEAGVISGGGLTAGQKEAVSFIKELAAGPEGARAAAAALIYAAATGGGAPEEQKELARKEMEELSRTEEGRALIERVKARFADKPEHFREFLGAWSKLGARRGMKMTMKEWEEQFELAKDVTHTGLLGYALAGEAYAGEARRRGYQMEGDVISAGGATEGTKAGEEASRIERQLKALEQLAKDFPDATSDLKVAAKELQKAAQMMNPNIEKEIEWLRKTTSG